jgi:hypothetical protein
VRPHDPHLVLTMNFIDPRTARPGLSTPPANLARTWEELEHLHEFCRRGRIYDVEQWIVDGRPLQVAASDLPRRGRKRQTALEIGIERGDHSLVLLLLANGYDPNQESASPLDQALRARRWDLVDLLLDGGTRPAEVDPDAVFGTYHTALFERFCELGVDYTAGHALADALSHHTSNKPLFGFARRHRLDDPRYQKELNIALVHHTSRGNEKGVMLCLWAGADPHAPAPSLTYHAGSSDEPEDDDEEEYGVSAVWQACCSGHPEVLARFRPDPQLDDFDGLYRSARNPATLKVLLDIEPPRHPGAVICSLVDDVLFKWSLERWGSLGYGRYESIHALETLFEEGVRWHDAEREEAAAVRASLIKLDEQDFVHIVKLLAAQDRCAPEVLREVGRTQAFRKRMKDVGFIPPDAKDRGRRRYDPPTRAGEVLKKFGIELPKPPTPPAAEVFLPQEVWIGHRRQGAIECRMTRQELFDRVWKTPVEALATEWGLSGRGLAKACARVQVPVPPRGYWARVNAGQRPARPRLAALKHGEGQAIIVWQATAGAEHRRT